MAIHIKGKFPLASTFKGPDKNTHFFSKKPPLHPISFPPIFLLSSLKYDLDVLIKANELGKQQNHPHLLKEILCIVPLQPFKYSLFMHKQAPYIDSPYA